MNNQESSIKDIKSLKDDFNINLYEKILDLRKFEIENFWKRALFFWGTITIILVGYFKGDSLGKYSAFISLMGLSYTYIFSLSIRGSKYWQEYWEFMAADFEAKFGFNLLRKQDEFNQTINNKPIITAPFQFSVTKLTMLLSDLTVILWFLFWLKDIFLAYSNEFLKFDFSLSNKVHLFTINFIVFQFSIILYILYFLIKGQVYHKKSITN